MNRIITKWARCLRLNEGFLKSFLVEVMNVTCYIMNISPWTIPDGKGTEEVWTGNEMIILDREYLDVRLMCIYPIIRDPSLTQN